MEAQDSYTSSEIIRILQYCGIEEAHLADDPEDLHTELTRVDCKQGDFDFRCYLIGPGPLFAGMYLSTSIFCATSSPYEFANSLNSQLWNATFQVFSDEQDEVVRDDDGDPLILANASIIFDGGVRSGHIERRISLWIEDVLEGFGIDESILESSPISGVMVDEVKEMGIAEQIRWVLEIDSVPRTARQLAAFLMKKKPEVNSVLYRRSDLFIRDNSQPPRWSLFRTGD